MSNQDEKEWEWVTSSEYIPLMELHDRETDELIALYAFGFFEALRFQGAILHSTGIQYNIYDIQYLHVLEVEEDGQIILEDCEESTLGHSNITLVEV